MYCLFFFSYNRQELSGVIWGGGGVQQLASDKMVEILVQASNGQYPNKTSQFFYSDMLIISLRMFKEGGGGGGVDGVDAIQILAWSVFLGNFL